MVRAEACGCAGPARVLVRQPCLVFWLSLLVSLLLSVLPLLLFGMFEIDFTTDNFQVRGNDVANKYHAVQLAMEGTTLDDDRRRRALAEEHGGGRRLQDDGACNRFIDVFFHTGDGGDIFTGARITEASRLQARLLEIPGVRRLQRRQAAVAQRRQRRVFRVALRGVLDIRQRLAFEVLRGKQCTHALWSLPSLRSPVSQP